jgi:hypothetical protein
LRRLVRLHPGDQAEPGDLWDYSQDLLYTEIQGPLLAYLLPFCLEAWGQDVRGAQQGYGGFVEHFYSVLANRHIFDECLKPAQTAAAAEFMRQTILDEIDDQRGLAYQGNNARPYTWISAFTTYGVLLPDLGLLWREWWLLTTVGRAIAAVQYLSCLMYPESENPIFAPWTCDGGGGPPCLWEFAGYLYSHRWLDPNIDFMKTILNVDQVSEVLSRAAERLAGQPEHARASQVCADFPSRRATVESRCAELPRFLATTQQGTTLFEWST